MTSTEIVTILPKRFRVRVTKLWGWYFLYCCKGGYWLENIGESLQGERGKEETVWNPEEPVSLRVCQSQPIWVSISLCALLLKSLRCSLEPEEVPTHGPLCLPVSKIYWHLGNSVYIFSISWKGKVAGNEQLGYMLEYVIMLRLKKVENTHDDLNLI